MLDGLREELAAHGLSPFDIHLPGETADVAPLEGSLRLRQDERGYVLETVDYGRGWPLGRADSDAAARELVLGYVSRQLPGVAPIPRVDLEALLTTVAPHYFDVRDRAAAAGEAGIVIDLPAQLPLDRLGALDGVHLYPLDTPFELRSLPPHVLRPESEQHRFLTTTAVRVGAILAPPWFGQRGGGLRFTLQEPGVGIRDLVADGRLQRVHVVS